MMNLKAFQKAAEKFAKDLQPQTLVLLSGDLSAGKTEFVKQVVKTLGGQAVASPTFALHHEYKLKKGQVLDHWDLYRLESADDLESSGFWDQFLKKDFLIFVEWPERLAANEIPKNIRVAKISIKIISETERELVFS